MLAGANGKSLAGVGPFHQDAAVANPELQGTRVRSPAHVERRPCDQDLVWPGRHGPGRLGKMHEVCGQPAVLETDARPRASMAVTLARASAATAT